MTTETEPAGALAEMVRRIAVAAERYVPRARLRERRPGETGLRALIRAAFEKIEAMRADAFTWAEVREVLHSAEAIAATVTREQLRAEFGYQRRCREGKRRRRAKPPGGRKLPTARPEAGQHAPAPPAPVAGAAAGRADRPQWRPPSQGPAPAAGSGEVIRLEDGREFPADATHVPLVAPEKWSVLLRGKVYPGDIDAPMEPPVVEIKRLIGVNIKTLTPEALRDLVHGRD